MSYHRFVNKFKEENMITWLIAANVAFILVLVFAYFELENMALLALMCTFASGIVSCSESDWYKRDQKEMAAEAKRRATPHVIREADGCKVYAFETDREHYFTRCGSTVSTETNWSQSCGKNCSKKMSDTITTEGNK
jgi:hypothetical protein